MKSVSCFSKILQDLDQVSIHALYVWMFYDACIQEWTWSVGLELNPVMRKPVYKYVYNKCADKPVQPCSLISIFLVCCPYTGCPRKVATQNQFLITLNLFNRYKCLIYQFLGRTVVHICVKLQLKRLYTF